MGDDMSGEGGAEDGSLVADAIASFNSRRKSSKERREVSNSVCDTYIQCQLARQNVNVAYLGLSN